jgi:hypothetical protein
MLIVLFCLWLSVCLAGWLDALAGWLAGWLAEPGWLAVAGCWLAGCQPVHIFAEGSAKDVKVHIFVRNLLDTLES